MTTVPTNAIVEAIRDALEKQAAAAASARVIAENLSADDPEVLLTATVEASPEYAAEVAPLMAQVSEILARLSDQYRPTLDVPSTEQREQANADATEALKVFRKLLAAFTEAGGDPESVSDTAKSLGKSRSSAGAGDTRRPRFESIVVQSLTDPNRRVAYPLDVKSADGTVETLRPTFTQVADYCQNGITAKVLQDHYFDPSVGGESHQKSDKGSGESVSFTVTSPDSSRSFEITVTR